MTIIVLVGGGRIIWGKHISFSLVSHQDLPSIVQHHDLNRGVLFKAEPLVSMGHCYLLAGRRLS